MDYKESYDDMPCAGAEITVKTSEIVEFAADDSCAEIILSAISVQFKYCTVRNGIRIPVLISDDILLHADVFGYSVVLKYTNFWSSGDFWCAIGYVLSEEDTLEEQAYCEEASFSKGE